MNLAESFHARERKMLKSILFLQLNKVSFQVEQLF